MILMRKGETLNAPPSDKNPTMEKTGEERSSDRCIIRMKKHLEPRVMETFHLTMNILSYILFRSLLVCLFHCSVKDEGQSSGFLFFLWAGDGDNSSHQNLSCQGSGSKVDVSKSVFVLETEMNH